MIQYLIFLLVIISLIYNKYRVQPLINNANNKKIEEVIDTVGIENIMESLEKDDNFRKSSKELDEKLSEILKSEIQGKNKKT
jgi:hypothetical protein